MGRPTFRTLEDIRRRGGNLQVTCPKCGRTGTWAILGIIEHFNGKRWNTALEVAWERFRCVGHAGDPGCGHKGAHLDVVAPKPRYDRPPPPPIETTPRRRRR